MSLTKSSPNSKPHRLAECVYSVKTLIVQQTEDQVGFPFVVANDPDDIVLRADRRGAAAPYLQGVFKVLLCPRPALAILRPRLQESL